MRTVNSGYAEINNTSIYYEMKGEGKPLLLLHGLPIDSRMWDPQFDTLSKYYKVIRFDLAGYGKSGVHQDDYSLVEDVNSLLEYLEVESLSIIGLSVGGQIGIDYTLKYPERVESLLLISNGLAGWTKFSAERIQFNERINQCYENGNQQKIIHTLCDGWVAGPYRDLDNIDSDITNTFSEMITNTYSKERGNGKMILPTYKTINHVDEIKIPTLLVKSEFDFPEYNDIANYLHDKIKNSQIEKIRGTGHMVNMEKPMEFNEVVLHFLAQY